MKDKNTKLEYFGNGRFIFNSLQFFFKRKNYGKKGNTISKTVAHQ